VQVTNLLQELFINGFLHQLILWEQQDYVFAFQKLGKCLLDEKRDLAKRGISKVDFVGPVFIEGIVMKPLPPVLPKWADVKELVLLEFFRLQDMFSNPVRRLVLVRGQRLLADYFVPFVLFLLLNTLLYF
jgi:hypothetical protein